MTSGREHFAAGMALITPILRRLALILRQAALGLVELLSVWPHACQVGNRLSCWPRM